MKFDYEAYVERQRVFEDRMAEYDRKFYLMLGIINVLTGFLLGLLVAKVALG